MAVGVGPNLVAVFESMARRKGDAPFLWHRSDGRYQSISWNAVSSDSTHLSRALRVLGVESGDRVVLVSENRPEWVTADLAVMKAGGVTVPAYTTNTADDHAFIFNHSEASAVIVSGHRLAAPVIKALESSPSIRFLIFMEQFQEAASVSVTAVHWSDALTMGERSAAEPVDWETFVDPDDTACFIYTSGTGGTPKGVMLSHTNMLANCEAGIDVLKEADAFHDDHFFMSFLPLSHSYEHTMGQFFAISVGAQICYAEGLERLSDNLIEMKPTVLTCVPRLQEVIRQKMLTRIERTGGVQRWLFEKTLQIGRKKIEDPSTLTLLDRLMDPLCTLLVRKKVAERFGGRMEALISGGAPLNYDVGMFFAALGMTLIQGYGQTEASPLISVTRPGDNRFDTVGQPVSNVEVRIAEDGEIVVAGPNVMKGYWRDDEATAQTLVDGWLLTGDIGKFEDGGRLIITDRKKDMIVNSGGDNISPQRVEGILCLQAEVMQALVFGDNRPYLVALIVPDPDFTTRFAREHGLKPNLKEIVGNEQFRKALGQSVRKSNFSLSSIEKIRKYHIMDEQFTVENGMMTPTLKLRRQVIYHQYEGLFEGLYGGRSSTG